MRNNKSEKQKRNKGFPYKSKTYIGAPPNPINKYKVVDSEGNVIGTFRLKWSASQFVSTAEGKRYGWKIVVTEE